MQTLLDNILHLFLKHRSSSTHKTPAVRWTQRTQIAAICRSLPSPRALHRSSHEEGHLRSDAQERAPDRPLVCTNQKQIIFVFGRAQKGPFPTGVSNNAESNIQVTRHARGNSWFVCVCVCDGLGAGLLSLVCVCLISSRLCFHRPVRNWDGSLCDTHAKRRPSSQQEG